MKKEVSPMIAYAALAAMFFTSVNTINQSIFPIAPNEQTASVVQTGKVLGVVTLPQTCLTRDLQENTSGADVTALQNFLVAYLQNKGLTSVVGSATDRGYYGKNTTLDVTQFQASNPVTGLAATEVGKVYATTRAKINALACTTASVGFVYTRLSPYAPSKQTILVSPTTVTSDVLLGQFSVKVQNQSGTINSLSFNLNNSKGIATTSLYQNVRLYDGNGKLLAGANSLTAGNPTFNQLAIPLTQDVWMDLKVIADIPAGNAGVSASSTLVGKSIVGTDTNFNTLSVVNATNVTSGDSLYTSQMVNIVPSGATLSNCFSAYGQNYGWTSCDMALSFIATASANNIQDLYIGRLPGIALATSSSPYTSSTTLTSINIAAIAGDTSVSYRLPNGADRLFTYFGTFSKNGALLSPGTVETFRITGVNYGTSATNPTGQVVTSNLGPLFVSKTL